MAMLNNQMVSLQNGDLSTLNQENMGGWAAMAKWLGAGEWIVKNGLTFWNQKRDVKKSLLFLLQKTRIPAKSGSTQSRES